MLGISVILTALAVTALAAAGAVKKTAIPMMACGFAIALVIYTNGYQLDRDLLAIITMLAVVAQFSNLTIRNSIASVSAGVLAGYCADGLVQMGFGWPIGVILTFANLFVPWMLVHRSDSFARRDLREEALLVIAAITFVAWAIPAITTGWEAAVALNIDDETIAGIDRPKLWMPIVVIVSIFAGILSSLLKRH